MMTEAERARVKQAVLAALRQVYDPEIPVNIYELGLIYRLEITPEGRADILMTLTAPNCPVAGSLPAEVEQKVNAVPGVSAVKLDLTFDPPWTKDRMSPAAKLALGLGDYVDIRPLNR